MKLHLDYPTISSVQSFLYSHKPASKFLSETKVLVQSKHTTGSVANFGNIPSNQSIQKVSKIGAENIRSSGCCSNSNLLAFVNVAFEVAFNSKNDNYENFLIQKLSNQTQHLFNIQDIQNHNHECIQTQNMIRVIVAFLKTLKNKKLKNPQQFDLGKQLENLPIAMDYLIVICRGFMNNFNIDGANDYTSPVADNEVFNLMSQFFALNFIKKDSYYFFQDTNHFVFKNKNQYVFGSYGKMEKQLDKQKSAQKNNNSLGNKYQKDYNMHILQSSMQSGYNLISSQHADDSTPFFTNLSQKQINFKNNQNDQKKQNIKQKQKQKQKTQPKYSPTSCNQSKSSNKVIESKSSGFQVNVYTQQSKKFFNNKYRNKNNGQANYDSMKERIDHDVNILSSPATSQYTYDKKLIDRAFIKNGHQNTPTFKKKSNQKQPPVVCSPFPDYKRSKSDYCVNELFKFNQLHGRNEELQSCYHEDQEPMDKMFSWENDQRRLRRVQTICYKTCTTCHRRFYRNQINSNVVDIKIQYKNQIKQNQPKKGTNVPTINNAPQFLNKRFHKKSADAVIQARFNKNQEKQQNTHVKQKSYSSNGAQLSWLNRKNKIQNAQYKTASHPALQSHSPKKQETTKEIKLKNETNDIIYIPRNLLSNINLPINKSQVAQVNIERSFNDNSLMQKHERKIPENIFKDKSKSFLNFKSTKYIQRIKSIEKINFKQKICTVGGLLITSKDQYQTSRNTDNSTVNASNLITNENLINKMIPNNQNAIQRNLVIRNKSIQKKSLGFIKKESLKNDFSTVTY